MYSVAENEAWFVADDLEDTMSSFSIADYKEDIIAINPYLDRETAKRIAEVVCAELNRTNGGLLP